MGELETDGSGSIVGRWFGRVNDEPVGLEFLLDGRLAYAVLSGERAQTIRMAYRIDADHIITDQPSSPHEERTRFWLEDPDCLVVEFGGLATRFTRG